MGIITIYGGSFLPNRINTDVFKYFGYFRDRKADDVKKVAVHRFYKKASLFLNRVASCLIHRLKSVDIRGYFGVFKRSKDDFGSTKRAYLEIIAYYGIPCNNVMFSTREGFQHIKGVVSIPRLTQNLSVDCYDSVRADNGNTVSDAAIYLLRFGKRIYTRRFLGRKPLGDFLCNGRHYIKFKARNG